MVYNKVKTSAKTMVSCNNFRKKLEQDNFSLCSSTENKWHIKSTIKLIRLILINLSRMTIYYLGA